MLNRSKSSKDIRSRIKHENVRLGAGTQMGGVPNNFGLQTNAFQVQSQRTHQHSPSLGHRRDVFDAPDLYGGTSEVPSHNAHPLGAGPSFVSLSPSDSISNFEGRPGHAPRASSNQLFEPSAGSTASFAQNLNDASATPSRPARSMRRPQRESAASIQQTSIPVGRNLLHSTRADKSRYDAADTEDYDHRAIEQTPSSSHDRHARSARLMAQVHQGMDGRATPASMISDEDEAHAAINDDKHRSHSPLSSPPLGSLTRNERPTALNSVLNALTEAGRKQGQTRILRGVTAEEESRRRKIERKYEAAKSRESQPLEAYVDRQDERAFQEICAVLRKVKTEWDFVVDDDFNSVSLALSLLDDSSLGSSRQDFEQIKALIEHALQGTVDDHYESFATAISLHDNVLNSLGTAQSGVSGARRRLRDAREALGAKRADLVQLWHRSQAVKESIHLLDIIDNLKSVPDRLESLMAEKQFLEAVNLLMRAVKMCEKGEVLEVGATADLRVYLKGQEQAMFDILVEELHNHLYLKSYFCDSRWKSYTTGQTTLPDVDFGQDYEELKQNSSQRLNNNASRDDEDVDESLAKNSREHPIKLTKYLKALNLRPAPDAANDLMPDLISTSQNAVHESSELPSSKSTESFAATNSVQNQQYNPETDSFLYIEMLLESLARLGKLKMTQEVILQRLPVELHQLVDSTIEEVDTRSEMMRRSSSAVLRPESLLLSNSSALARSFSENARTSFRSSLTAPGNLSLGAVRMSALETGQVERDSETMRDLFWTLFSKLDAVLQGHRVIFEVVTKISSRKASSAYKAVKVGKPSSLTEIWRPIQTEVRNLLHEYLVDEAETSSARRNAIISVNEVLRQGSFHRDRSKPLFRLVADSAPKPGVNLSRRDFAPLRKHEEALSNALRASVPGLVGTSDGSNSSAVYQKAATSLSPSGREGAGGHKLLVKPDAFNISVLFQPALAFIERVKVLLPPEAAGRSEGDDADGTGTGFSRFLDEFVRDVFLSQLEDKVQTLFSMAVSGSDAFQEDAMYRARSAEKPIVRSVTNVVVLIDSLYSMLRTTPFHRESYSLLIIQIIVQYYQRCHDRFRDLVSSDVTIHAADNTPVSVQPAILSAIWAERPEISNCLLEILDPDSTLERQKELRSLENALELRLAGTVRDSSAGSQQPRSCTTIALKDLMTNRKKLLALGNLYNSLLWFRDHISKLKATDQGVETTTKAMARLSVINQLSPNVGEDDSEELKLPLNASMLPRFQTLTRVYSHLAHLVLFTLRLEVRARTIHHIDLAINEGNYLVEDAVLEPDPHIVDLNSELASLDDIFADTVLPKDHSFLFHDLASLMDLQLCQAIRKVRFINRNGLTKMIRNILALQQNLRNLVVVHEAMTRPSPGSASEQVDEDTELEARYSGSYDGFEKCRKLWELVGKEPEYLLASIRQSGPQHSFDDYHSALNLMLGLENGKITSSNVSATLSDQSQQGPNPPGANLRPGTSEKPREVSRQKLNEYLIELHEVAGEAF